MIKQNIIIVQKSNKKQTWSARRPDENFSDKTFDGFIQLLKIQMLGTKKKRQRNLIQRIKEG